MAERAPVSQHRCDFWVLIEPADDVPGQWVAHCLNLDVMSQGNSPLHARDMIAEAIALTLADDFEHHRNPWTRPSAPKEFWDKLQDVFENGRQVRLSEIDVAQPGLRLAMLLPFNIVKVDEPQPIEEAVPPPWLIHAMSTPPPQRLNI